MTTTTYPTTHRPVTPVIVAIVALVLASLVVAAAIGSDSANSRSYDGHPRLYGGRVATQISPR